MEMGEQRNLTVGGDGLSVQHKPVPMKLFSTWDIDKSSPSCIPRICTLSLSRITIEKPLENEAHDIIVALKMLISKRILRCNEIYVPKNGIIDVELDLTFSLQYSHSMKRNGNNQLKILLQRRKKYRNRAMLGYRTLAVATINLMEVLQYSNDREIMLYAYEKQHETTDIVAKLTLLSLSTQAFDLEEAHVGKEGFSLTEDEDDPASTSQDDTSDIDYPHLSHLHRHHHQSTPLKHSIHNRQKNLKQKIISLLRRFKLSDDVFESAVRGIKINSHTVNEILNDVETLSDSAPDDDEEEGDSLSIHSNPKPQLKPFFDARLNNIFGAIKSEELAIQTQPSKLEIDLNQKKKLKFVNKELPRSLASYADAECLIFAQFNDHFTEPLKEMLHSENHPLIITSNQFEIKSAINSAFIRAQQMKNSSVSAASSSSLPSLATSSNQLKLALLGTEEYIGSFVRLVVENFASKLVDLLNFIRFLIIPLGSGAINKNLSRMDAKFAALFRDPVWKDNTCQNKGDSLSKQNFHIDYSEIGRRILHYVVKADHLIQFPFAEVIIANKDRNNGDSSQMVLPFLGEVRLGPMEHECEVLGESILSSSPPNSNPTSNSAQFTFTTTNMNLELPSDLIDLQVDYWMLPTKSDQINNSNNDKLVVKKEVKCTLKSAFKSIQIYKGSRP